MVLICAAIGSGRDFLHRIVGELVACAMRLTFSDRRFISEVTDLETRAEVGNSPVEFSGSISSAGAQALREQTAAFYRAEDGEARFTLTIDKVSQGRIAGTIRRR